MTLAVSTAGAILAWLGLAVGAVILVVVVALFARIMRPAREIDAYARHIQAAGDGIARNLEATEKLATTRSLGAAVPELAGAYLRKLGPAR